MPHFFDFTACDTDFMQQSCKGQTLDSSKMNEVLATPPKSTLQASVETPQGGLETDKTASTSNGGPVDWTSSRPPSPPSSGTTTPTLTLAPCPPRLFCIYPPVNYGVVENNLLFRSAFPQDRNIDFMTSLKVKNVLCLVDTEPSAAYNAWLERGGIQRHRIDIAPNKDGKINTSWDSLCQAVLMVMDPANYPLHIHCNQGKHRTGCVVACLRKVQRVPMDEILQEYVDYSWPKQRTGDMDLIRAFDPEAVYEYAKRNGYFNDRHFMRRLDSTVSNIDSLAAALNTASAHTAYDDLELALVDTNSTSTFDEGLEMHVDEIMTGKSHHAEMHVDEIMTGKTHHAANTTSGQNDEPGGPQTATDVAETNGTKTTVVELSDE